MRCAICETPDAEFPDPAEPEAATRGLCGICWRREGAR
jgi:hypothetical protein